MKLRKTLSAGLLAIMLATGIDAAPRRRAVSRPSPPSHIMVNMAADDDLRYTNHGTGVANVRTCIERTNQCITDTLAPGQSVTNIDPVRELGRESANLEIYANQPLEARGHNDALPTHVMTTERQNIPHMVPGQTLAVYTWTPGTAELITRGYNGVQKNIQTVDLAAGTTTIALPGIPGSLGDQYDLLPTVNTIATSTIDGVVHRAKTFNEARGQQFIVKADPTTFGFAKNIDPTSILALDSALYQHNEENLAADYVRNHSALNWGVTYVNELTNDMTGSVLLQGGRRDQSYTPFLIWTNWGTQTEANAATSQSGLGSINTLYNTSMNQVPDQVTILNVGELSTVSGQIAGINDEGTTIGTLNYELPSWGNKDVDLTSLKQSGATRILVSANNSTIPVGGYPVVLVSGNVDGVVKAGHHVEKPIPKVTGEEYVA
ncbi:MAG: hypothetical protein ACREQV_09010, partial [Candidatus Binatia bacterium]